MKKQNIIFIFFILPLAINAQISIDLNEMVLNDSIKISELNVETITNILGRPSAVKNNEAIIDIVGNQLFYHELGLSFWFYSKKQDSKRRLMTMDLYLSQRWDEYSSKFFIPFSGILIPNIDANMKINDLIPVFQNDSSYIVTAQKKSELVDTPNFWIGRDKYDSLILKKIECSVALNFEEVTKYIEDIIILFESISSSEDL